MKTEYVLGAFLWSFVGILVILVDMITGATIYEAVFDLATLGMIIVGAWVIYYLVKRRSVPPAVRGPRALTGVLFLAIIIMVVLWAIWLNLLYF